MTNQADALKNFLEISYEKLAEMNSDLFGPGKVIVFASVLNEDRSVCESDFRLMLKLVCRQIANSCGMTATFLPKPIANINGSGMHFNISFSKDGKNLFYDKNGENSRSE